jgi:multidrug efflux system membrane fusion protein
MTLPGPQPNPNAIRRSYVVAGIIFFILAAWVASGMFSSDPGTQPSASQTARTEAAAKAAAASKPMVRVRTLKQEKRRQDHIIRGQTEALRKVIVRAEIAGKVQAIRADRGTPVKAGDVICEIAVDERGAMLKQARAVMKQRKLEYDASRQLNQKGFRSETALAGDQAEYEAALAQVERMETQLDDTKIRAPFEGVVDARMADVGDYLAPGQPCAMVIDQDPFLVVGQASERDVGSISRGDSGWAKLVTGERVEGKIRFVSTSADPATRTFRVELEIPNPKGTIRDGITAEMHVAGKEVVAHRVSPAILALDDKGNLGVRIVEAGNRVKFVAVTMVSDTPQGVWVAGLPETATVITVGQEYVTPGQEVQVTEDQAATAPDAGKKAPTP